MTQTVALPIWLFVLILLFAAVTFASHFLFPSVRWFFRRRMEKAVARLNLRLARPIQPFKLATRYDTIQRLIYDPAVTTAVVEQAHSEGIPENVAFEQARRYAREIVPSFSATVYFSFGIRIARWLARSLYRVRVGAFDRETLEKLDPNATVIFVMNHRSNMDYLLVTYLVAGQSTLSYAVGEWARVWPLSWLIRAMGAYFIRRKFLGTLYRRILARYVQMATAAGVTQAVFPEGGLSLTGQMAPARLGILSYIIEDYRPGGRDVIFVPVALNYDRVIEDRFLINAGLNGNRRFRPPNSVMLKALGSHLWQRLTRRFRRFGTATVSFGEPLSLAGMIGQADGSPTETVATELMARLSRAVPILPVPLVCRLILARPGLTREALEQDVRDVLSGFADGTVTLPRRSAAQVTDDGLAILWERKLICEQAGGIGITAGEAPVLAYYAASIAQHFAADAGPAAQVSALAKQ
jgi:glycerol-3-phosphate O-acyltransferase